MTPPDPDPSVALYEERLVPAVQTTPYRRVRVAKRVVVERRTITVDVRREELVVEDLPLEGAGVGPADPTTHRGAEPLVLVLSEEVPDEVLLRTEPREIVRVHVDRLAHAEQVHATLRREQAEVETDQPTA